MVVGRGGASEGPPGQSDGTDLRTEISLGAGGTPVEGCWATGLADPGCDCHLRLAGLGQVTYGASGVGRIHLGGLLGLWASNKRMKEWARLSATTGQRLPRSRQLTVHPGVGL